MLCQILSAVPIQRRVGTGILQKNHMLCILMPRLLLPMLPLNMSRVEKEQAKKTTAPPILAPVFIKRLKSTGAKVLSTSALISDYTVFFQQKFPDQSSESQDKIL